MDFVDNYDATMKEPTLLPVTFPAILVNANMGIAVGMASSICPFNLAEVCETTIALMNNPNHDMLATLTAPDFPGGGLYPLRPGRSCDKIYDTGRGSVTGAGQLHLRQGRTTASTSPRSRPPPRWRPSWTRSSSWSRRARSGRSADMRDETDLSGLKITIDLKRGVDPDKLMAQAVPA